jgi:hypothetical protein
MDSEHTTDRRVRFDFEEVDFSNGGGPQGYAVGASEAFRRVSLGTSVNKGKGRAGAVRPRPSLFFASRTLTTTTTTRG